MVQRVMSSRYAEEVRCDWMKIQGLPLKKRDLFRIRRMMSNAMITVFRKYDPGFAYSVMDPQFQSLGTVAIENRFSLLDIEPQMTKDGWFTPVPVLTVNSSEDYPDHFLFHHEIGHLFSTGLYHIGRNTVIHRTGCLTCRYTVEDNQAVFQSQEGDTLLNEICTDLFALFQVGYDGTDQADHYMIPPARTARILTLLRQAQNKGINCSTLLSLYLSDSEEEKKSLRQFDALEIIRHCGV